MEKKKKTTAILIIIAILVISAVLGVITYHLITNLEFLKTEVERLGWISKIIFILMVIVQVVVAIIPGGPFETAAGYLWGSLEGSVICLIGCTMGSMIVFLLVRKFGMKIVRVFFNDKQIESASFIMDSPKWNWFLAVMFLIPGTPKDLLSYVAGLTKINIWLWLVICSLGRLPAIIMSAIGGASFFKKDYMFVIIIFAILILVSLVGAYIYKKMGKK